MPQRIQIDESKKRERKEHLRISIQALQGKCISDMKQNELLELVEYICYLNQICDAAGIIL